MEITMVGIVQAVFWFFVIMTLVNRALKGKEFKPISLGSEIVSAGFWVGAYLVFGGSISIPFYLLVGIVVFNFINVLALNSRKEMDTLTPETTTTAFAIMLVLFYLGGAI